MRKVVVLACILSILVSAVVLVGCGGGSSTQTPQQVIQVFWDALMKNDATTTWNMMSSDSQKAAGSKSEWEAALRQGLHMVKVTIGKATINGNKATIKVTGTVNGKTNTVSMPLIKENGVWKVDISASSTQ